MILLLLMLSCVNSVKWGLDVDGITGITDYLSRELVDVKLKAITLLEIMFSYINCSIASVIMSCF